MLGFFLRLRYDTLMMYTWALKQLLSQYADQFWSIAFKLKEMLEMKDQNQHWKSLVCVAKAWYIVFLCAIELHLKAT